jgi:hypothetical protein
MTTNLEFFSGNHFVSMFYLISDEEKKERKNISYLNRLHLRPLLGGENECWRFIRDSGNIYFTTFSLICLYEAYYDKLIECNELLFELMKVSFDSLKFDKRVNIQQQQEKFTDGKYMSQFLLHETERLCLEWDRMQINVSQHEIINSAIVFASLTGSALTLYSDEDMMNLVIQFIESKQFEQAQKLVFIQLIATANEKIERIKPKKKEQLELNRLVEINAKDFYVFSGGECCLKRFKNKVKFYENLHKATKKVKEHVFETAKIKMQMKIEKMKEKEKEEKEKNLQK